MKKLGLVGGTGPESTLVYYKELNYAVNRALGGKAYPPLTIESIDVFRALDYCAKGQEDALLAYLLEAVENLAAAGAQFAALTGNTVHLVFDRLQAASPIPLVSILEATCQEAGRRGMKKLGLLGTKVTMEGAFFSEPFRRAGIQLVVPQGQQLQFVDEKISTELEYGVVKEETRAAFLALVETMKQEQGIEGLVLGCTELPLLFDGVACPVPCLDTMRIHMDTLVAGILED